MKKAFVAAALFLSLAAAAQNETTISVTPAAASRNGIAWSMGTLHGAHRTPAGIEAQAIVTDITIRQYDNYVAVNAAGAFSWQVVAITGVTLAGGKATDSATIELPRTGGVYIVVVNTAHAVKTYKIIVR